jgi:hypothetical protein
MLTAQELTAMRQEDLLLINLILGAVEILIQP